MQAGKTAQSGFAYLYVLMLIALIGMGLAATGTLWRTDAQRAREAELLFVGDQYRQAIRSYYLLDAAQPRLPLRVDDLLADTRRPDPVRHLRRAYPDPVTGAPFVLIPVTGGPGIVGVHSPSAQRPFKRAGFSIENETFTDASRYSEWRFVFEPPVAAPLVPSGLVPPPPPAGITP
jgi:type II secretory pathway pseudopilin PulG